MKSNLQTSAYIDGILKLAMSSGAIALTIMAPNALAVLDTPLKKALGQFDERSRQRELARITAYMKKQGLVTGSYQHGLIITNKGRKRLEKVNFDNLTITKPNRWDKTWRLVMFDVPETYRHSRVALTNKLHELGFQLLQQSVWVHPFPCRDEIAAIAEAFGVSKYLTYIETNYIDHQDKLIQRFSHILNQ